MLSTATPKLAEHGHKQLDLTASVLEMLCRPGTSRHELMHGRKDEAVAKLMTLLKSLVLTDSNVTFNDMNTSALCSLTRLEASRWLRGLGPHQDVLDLTTFTALLALSRHRMYILTLAPSTRKPLRPTHCNDLQLDSREARELQIFYCGFENRREILATLPSHTSSFCANRRANGNKAALTRTHGRCFWRTYH